MLDVTEDAKEIMKAVRDINMRKNCNLTLVYLTDIFKGSDLKKIRESGLYLLCIVIVKKIELVFVSILSMVFVSIASMIQLNNSFYRSNETSFIWSR